MKQASTYVEDREYELFQQTTANIGTTTSVALRMFIYAFNDHHGFPYPVQSRRMQVEAFETEDEATRFATDLAMEMVK
ncbi:MAG: translation repressor RelB [Clostridia bacterium]|nr:translation repressor RelB [Clostridia bacterium]MBR1686195.1 translation repressor RelB [Clostridia bacterium]MBR2288984.1 translation repressor RelB [Clostridia bacterium]